MIIYLLLVKYLNSGEDIMYLEREKEYNGYHLVSIFQNHTYLHLYDCREIQKLRDSSHSLISRLWAAVYRAFGENHFHMFTWGELQNEVQPSLWE